MDTFDDTIKDSSEHEHMEKIDSASKSTEDFAVKNDVEETSEDKEQTKNNISIEVVKENHLKDSFNEASTEEFDVDIDVKKNDEVMEQTKSEEYSTKNFDAENDVIEDSEDLEQTKIDDPIEITKEIVLNNSTNENSNEEFDADNDVKKISEDLKETKSDISIEVMKETKSNNSTKETNTEEFDAGIDVPKTSEDMKQTKDDVAIEVMKEIELKDFNKESNKNILQTMGIDTYQYDSQERIKQPPQSTEELLENKSIYSDISHQELENSQEVEDNVSELSDEYLDGAHELMAPLQDALKTQVKNAAARAAAALREKKEESMRIRKKREEIGVTLYSRQQQLARLQMKLESTHDRFNVFLRLRTRAEEEHSELVAEAKVQESAKDISQTHLETHQRNLQELHSTLRQVEAHNEKAKGDILVTRRSAYAEEKEMQKLEKEKKRQDFNIADLSDQVRQLEKHVNSVQNQLHTQNNQNQNARKTLQCAQREMNMIVTEKNSAFVQWRSAVIALTRRDEAVQEGEKTRTELVETNQLCSAEREGLENTIRIEHAKHEQLSALLTKVVTNARYLEKQIEVIRSRREACGNDYDQARHDLEVIDSELTQAVADRKNLDADVERLRKLIAKTDTSRRHIDAQIVENISSQSNIEQGAQNTLKGVTGVKSEISEVEGKIIDTHNELARVRVDSLNAAAHSQELTKAFRDYETELKRKEELVQNYENEIALRHSRINKQQGVVDNLNRSYESLTMKADDFNDNVGPLEATISSMRRELSQTKEQNGTLQRSWIRAQTLLVEQSAGHSEARDTLRGLHARQTIVNAALSRLTQECAGENGEIHTIHKEIDALHHGLHRLNCLSSQLSAKQSSLTSSIAVVELDFKARLNELKSLSESSKDNIEKSREANEDAVQQIIELEKQILIWERRIKLEHETQDALDPEIGQSEVRELQREVHRMRLQLDSIIRQQKKLISDAEGAILKREDIQIRNMHTKREKLTRASVKKKIDMLKTKLKQSMKQTKMIETQIVKQENDNQVLRDMLERVQNEHDQVDETACQVKHRIDLATLKQNLGSKSMMLMKTRRQRLHHIATSSCDVNTSETAATRVDGELSKQIERCESLKEALRTLKAQHHDDPQEETFDVLLEFLSAK